MRKHLSPVVYIDFEYESAPGGLPNTLCMVAIVLDENLRHVRTIKQWRGEFGPEPPFDIGPDALVVAYSAQAEMMCFQQLGWKFPVHIFDQHIAYLAATNVLSPYDPDADRIQADKGFEAACEAYGLHGWEGMNKDAIRTSIGDGSWVHKYSRQEVMDYCEEDTRMGVRLLREQLQPFVDLPVTDPALILNWSNYAGKCVAQIQTKGMHIDTYLWHLVQEHMAAVIHRLLEKFDPSHCTDFPIYNEDGEWSDARFERWLAAVGIYYWPRLRTGKLDLDSDAFRLMYSTYPPHIEDLHYLRDSLGFIQKARLPIGPDGRNRPSLFPFATSTGRNAHRRSPFNASAGVRSFMTCPKGQVMFYLDYQSQEPGIAGWRSGDETLKADYSGGDIYHAYARMCGLTQDPDHKHWKGTAEGKATRKLMKPVSLAITYGMGVPSLAKKLDRHLLTAAAIIRLHKKRYPRFWQWREDVVRGAFNDRWIESSHRWRLRLTTSPNTRTLYNFPMQSIGGEILREATLRLCGAGIIPVMLVHDGILFQETSPEKMIEAKEIMLDAGRKVCGGFTIDVGESAIGRDPATGLITRRILTGGERYRDDRDKAKELWTEIMLALEAVGALPQGTALAA
jgi:DNA polymerase I